MRRFRLSLLLSSLSLWSIFHLLGQAKIVRCHIGYFIHLYAINRARISCRFEASLLSAFNIIEKLLKLRMTLLLSCEKNLVDGGHIIVPTADFWKLKLVCLYLFLWTHFRSWQLALAVFNRSAFSFTISFHFASFGI